MRVNVAFCKEDVETLREYAVQRSKESAYSSDPSSYEEAISDGGNIANRALVLVSIGFDDYGDFLYTFSSSEKNELSGLDDWEFPSDEPDAFLEAEGAKFLKTVVYERTQSVAEVGMDNQAFIAAEEAIPFDKRLELSSLREIFQKYDNKCRDVLKARWDDVFEKYASIEGELKGEDVEEVVEKLAAPHLRPTSMLRRFDDGIDAAAFGVATLISNMVK